LPKIILSENSKIFVAAGAKDTKKARLKIKTRGDSKKITLDTNKESGSNVDKYVAIQED
jgi:hypothetical protein